MRIIIPILLILLISLLKIGYSQTRQNVPGYPLSLEIPAEFTLNQSNKIIGPKFSRNDSYIHIYFETESNCDSLLNIDLESHLGWSKSSVVFKMDTIINGKKCIFLKCQKEFLGMYEYTLLICGKKKTYCIVGDYYLNKTQTEQNPINDEITRKILFSAILKE